MSLNINLKGRKAPSRRGVARHRQETPSARRPGATSRLATNALALARRARGARPRRVAQAIPCDISVTAQIERPSRSPSSLWRPDILVNNAGVTRDNLLIRMKEDEWDKVLGVNLKGSFLFMKAASRHLMRSKCGRIINIASVAGLIGNPGQANYSASKAGLMALTKSAAREFASRAICINAVAPGFIKTDMAAGVDEKTLATAIDNIPFHRMGEPREVAEVVVFLASDMARYITGQVIVVDGGMAM
jgi:3-oxoacyl-[acyl-carrier protein] reductase